MMRRLPHALLTMLTSSLRWPRWRFGDLHDIPLFESALHGLIFPDETLNLRVQTVLQQIKEIMKAGR
jgi:hypothetical protein